MKEDWRADKALWADFFRRRPQDGPKRRASPQEAQGPPGATAAGESVPAGAAPGALAGVGTCPDHPPPGRALTARRRLLLALLSYGLVMLGLGTRNGRVLALVLPLLIYLGTAFFYSPQRLVLGVTRTLSADRVTQGAKVEVKLTITNPGPALEEVLLVDCAPPALDVGEDSTRLRCEIPAGGTLEWSYTVNAKRGNYRFRGVHVLAGDRLGLFWRQATFAAPGQLFVLPEVTRIKRVLIRPQRTRVYSGQIPARVGGPGVEFFGVRDYQPGDPMRWINWRMTARRMEGFLISEFEQERAADVGLILDTRRRGYRRLGEEALFEYAVQAAAALADRFLGDGNRVGLLLYGDLLSWTFPGYGKVQRERILQALAQAELGESLYFDQFGNLPTRLFPTHSQVVLVSPLLTEDLPMLVLLRARGYQLLVISPDPVSYEEKLLLPAPEMRLGARIARLERVLLLRKLLQAGVRVLDWQTDTPFEQAVHAALGRQLVWFRAVGVEA